MQATGDRTFPLFPHCYVCGHENPQGLHAVFSPGELEMVKADFTPKPVHRGYEEIVHGGIIGALLDEALIWACYYRNNIFGVTAEITIRYLTPLLIGTPCQVSGRCLKAGGRISLAESWIRDASGTVYAKATGKVVKNSSSN